MLRPVTREMTDRSTPLEYRFTFHCDICHSGWDSVPVVSTTEYTDEETRAREHEAAYERANLEAIQHFNRCPICKRMVCDECFCILPVRDICLVCARQIDE